MLEVNAFHWHFLHLRAQRESGVLRPVTRGLYLNQLARPRPQAAEAAAYVRTGAVVSLQAVLGDAFVSNKYSDIVTCVVPIRDGVAPSNRPVKAERIEFRFHAMPCPFSTWTSAPARWRIDSIWMSSVRAPRPRRPCSTGST